jgi:hypothetical protein
LESHPDVILERRNWIVKPTKTEAIKKLLSAWTHADLAGMYNHDMECQVNAARDNGEIVEGEYKGTNWKGYTDYDQTWKSFRIPYGAMDNPRFNDREITWDLAAHAEGIGMTGWDWKNKVSKWVAYDFDAIIGHSEQHQQKISNEEMQEVQQAATEIPWVTVRYSTSGRGLHLYVFLDDVPTQTHTEHAAVARAILGKMSALAGFDFKSKVDTCGGNMWVWHRKMKDAPNGLKLIKKGCQLTEIPANWRDHLNVIRGRSRRVSHNLPGGKENNDKFEIVTGQRTSVKLDSDHQKLINWLNTNASGSFGWDSDRHMLVTHTVRLKHAHEALGFKGIYETCSESVGTELDEQNCFAFPLRRGGWCVRRYSMGISEHASWEQDGHGWTRCYFNVEPTFKTAAFAAEGVEDPAGGFVFQSMADAKNAARSIGAEIDSPPGMDGRETHIKMHKDGKRLVVTMSQKAGDQIAGMKGWLSKSNKWIRILNANQQRAVDNDVEDFDDILRHVVSSAGDNAGWFLNCENRWNSEPLEHIKRALASLGLPHGEISQIVGANIFKPWYLVNLPFQPEYPGDRRWNRDSPQLLYLPSQKDDLNYPTWKKILTHVGQSLDPVLLENQWAKENGIVTGADYLLLWAASMIQFPLKQLPYLFIYGEKQNTGKSSFYEALSLLFHPGYQQANATLTNQQAFNGELANVVLCAVEELDLNANKTAYNRIKDWVTALQIMIHPKKKTPYMINNATHWVHCANPRSACPVFPGDTRITMLHVPGPPDVVIPKHTLIQQLKKEAPDFLGEILRLEIPESDDRLNVPVIETADKVVASEANQTSLEMFVREKCHTAPGEVISIAEFYSTFVEWLDPSERYQWTKQKVSKFMPSRIPKGRLTTSPHWHWGNISFSESRNPQATPLVIERDRLVPKG